MIRVLVADDERWIRKGIVRMLDCEGLGIGEVYEAESVEQAMEIFREKLPEIVLTDVKFPTEDGCDFGDWIYAARRETKVVMISAFDAFENARRALRFNAVDYLVKPVSRNLLNATVRRCIESIREEAAPEPREGKSGGREQDSREQEMLPEESASVQAVRNLAERLKEDCGKHYTLTGMAEECHVTENYFSGLFKKVTGVSPMSWLTKARMEKAEELMLTTNLKLVRIAESVGYTDYQYFTKVFKKTLGVTPGEYRSRLKRETESEQV